MQPAVLAAVTSASMRKFICSSSSAGVAGWSKIGLRAPGLTDAVCSYVLATQSTDTRSSGWVTGSTMRRPSRYEARPSRIDCR